MSLTTSENTSDLARMFAGAAAVTAIRLPYVTGAAISPELQRQLRNELSKILKEQIAPDTILVPSADGFLAVSSSGAVDSKTLSAFQSIVADRMRELGLDGFLDSAGISINKLTPAPKQYGVDVVNHASFIRMEFRERMRVLSELQGGLDADALCWSQVMNLETMQPAGLYCNYASLPKPGEVFGKRMNDTYYDPDPQYAAIDIWLLRQSMKLITQMLESGRRWPVYVPLGLPNLLDQQTFKCYELELRNVPVTLRGFLALDLVRIHGGTPASRIAQIVGKLRPFVDYVSICLPPEWRQFEDIYFIGANEVGVALANQGRNQPGPSIGIEHARKFARISQNSNVPVSVRNVDQRDLPNISRAMEIDYAVIKHKTRRAGPADPPPSTGTDPSWV